jgi:hypothetical protein
MKKTLLKTLTVSFLAAATVSIAQPTLTATGTNPVIGNSFTYTGTGYFNPGASGAGQTWNFSTLSGTTGGASNCVSVASTPNGASFPNANIAFNNTGTSNYSYFKTSSAAYQSYGNVSSAGVVMSNSNPEDFLRFPFAYTNSYTDPWAVTFVNGGATFYRTGNTTVTADGYGTLIIPSGTFTNVMRVHFVQNYKDSANFGGTPYIITYTNDEYMWYSNSAHAALAATFTFSSTPGGGSSAGFYLGSPVGIDEISGYLDGFRVFPNPVQDDLTIDFNLIESSAYVVSIYNTLGQSVLRSESESQAIGKTSVQMNVSELTEGIYFAEILLDNNRRISRRFVVSK